MMRLMYHGNFLSLLNDTFPHEECGAPPFHGLSFHCKPNSSYAQPVRAPQRKMGAALGAV